MFVDYCIHVVLGPSSSLSSSLEISLESDSSCDGWLSWELHRRRRFDFSSSSSMRRFAALEVVVPELVDPDDDVGVDAFLLVLAVEASAVLVMLEDEPKNLLIGPSSEVDPVFERFDFFVFTDLLFVEAEEHGNATGATGSGVAGVLAAELAGTFMSSK